MKVSWDSLVHSTCVKFFYLKWFIKDCNKADDNNINTHNLNNNDDVNDDSTTEETSKYFVIVKTVKTIII